MTRLIHCSSVSSVFSSVSFELLDHPDISTPLDVHRHRNPAGDLGRTPPPLVSPFRPGPCRGSPSMYRPCQPYRSLHAPVDSDCTWPHGTMGSHRPGGGGPPGRTAQAQAQAHSAANRDGGPVLTGPWRYPRAPPACSAVLRPRGGFSTPPPLFYRVHHAGGGKVYWGASKSSGDHISTSLPPEMHFADM